ncbi:MAG TPA: hypothetical protein PKN37_07000, partial [Mesotoga sp.]|nr:hypothetical protein [Mesotoga sp.]
PLAFYRIKTFRTTLAYHNIVLLIEQATRSEITWILPERDKIVIFHEVEEIVEKTARTTKISSVTTSGHIKY